MHTDIFIFGDSIGFGKYDSRGGWTYRLNEFFETDYLAGGGAKRTSIISRYRAIELKTYWNVLNRK